MTELEELLERFRRGPDVVAVAATGVAGSQLDFSPAPGKWSIRQIVCHLADAELVTGVRLRRVIAEEEPVLEAFDQDAWALRLGYSRRRFSAALESFRRLRGENYELLRALEPEAFERRARHAETDPLRLIDLVRSAAQHAEAHARQILEIRDAYRDRQAGGGSGA